MLLLTPNQKLHVVSRGIRGKRPTMQVVIKETVNNREFSYTCHLHKLGDSWWGYPLMWNGKGKPRPVKWELAAAVMKSF